MLNRGFKVQNPIVRFTVKLWGREALYYVYKCRQKTQRAPLGAFRWFGDTYCVLTEGVDGKVDWTPRASVSRRVVYILYTISMVYFGC